MQNQIGLILFDHRICVLHKLGAFTKHSHAITEIKIQQFKLFLYGFFISKITEKLKTPVAAAQPCKVKLQK